MATAMTVPRPELTSAMAAGLIGSGHDDASSRSYCRFWTRHARHLSLRLWWRRPVPPTAGCAAFSPVADPESDHGRAQNS